MQKPVHHIVNVVYPLRVRLTRLWLVREVNARNTAVLIALTKEILVVKQTQLLDDVVHDQVGVDGRLVTNNLLVRVAQLDHLLDVKTLIWVKLEHPSDHTSQLLTVFLI